MVDTAAELAFPLMAGSSLPITARLPSIDLPHGLAVEEALCLGQKPADCCVSKASSSSWSINLCIVATIAGVGGPDGYDIHCLEALQALMERRRGGETGVVLP